MFVAVGVLERVRRGIVVGPAPKFIKLGQNTRAAAHVGPGQAEIVEGAGPLAVREFEGFGFTGVVGGSHGGRQLRRGLHRQALGRHAV